MAWALAGLSLAWVSATALWPSYRPPRPQVGYTDKVQHLTVWLALALAWWPLAARLSAGRSAARRGALVWAALVVYGALIEVLQLAVPGRSAELLDLVADALGAAVGVGLALAWERWRAGRARR